MFGKMIINIEKDILNQFAGQLLVKRDKNHLHFDTVLGKGNILRTKFPDSLEFYHFVFNLKKPLELSSQNPPNSDYFLLNINLSDKELEKKVDGLRLNIQKYLPSGILYYPPNIRVISKSPVDENFEIVLVKFHKDLLGSYFEESKDFIYRVKDTIIYEDLDATSEKLLLKIIQSTNKLKSHSHLLNFLSIFFDKLSKRESQVKFENVHPEDIKQLFTAASLLRDPVKKDIPSVDELAKIAGMGKTKFKKIFKQVFGSPPKQYHHKIKMDFAKDELLKKIKSSSEIAYDLGYAHPSKFTRAFKNYFGDLPSRIQKDF